MLDEDALHLVKEPLSLAFIQRGDLLRHQLVDARFPLRRRLWLTDVPQMRGTGTEPEVRTDRGIEIRSRRTEEDRVVGRAADVVEKRRRVERHDVHGDADLLQIVAHNRGATFVPW